MKPSKIDKDQLYTSSELAKDVGITPRAIRFYESKGLISPQRAGSNRVYDYRDHARMLIILRGKRLGFSLAEIKEYLDLYDADTEHKVQLNRLHEGVRERQQALELQRQDLETTLDELRDIEDQILEAMQRAGMSAAE